MGETKLGKFTVLFPNGREYHFLKREIWNQKSYFFKSNKSQPFIVDIGSHIGISVLYFKYIYPHSRILAFEPNPHSFDILNENIHRNGLEDIKTVNKAVSSKTGSTVLHIDATSNGWESNSSLMEGSWNGRESTKGISIESTTLDSYLKGIECINMLKIDTEGSELDILKSHRKILPRVENISVEYHPVVNRKIKKVLEILKEYFSLDIYMDGKLLKNIPENKLLTIQGKKRK